MLFLYDLGIRIYNFLVLLASYKNRKALAWIEGRKNIFLHIEDEINKDKKHIWFHFASLGEFEQGRPVLEEINSIYPGYSIIITFFSPSGYEIRKDYELADNVFYLPLDTRRNAHEFIKLIKPSIAIFTKYEYWYHYFEELNSEKIPLFIISGIFRKEQPFFKWYGSLHRRMLSMVSHFFVQNEESKVLLSSLGFQNVTVAGDTRFDRVVKNAKQAPAFKRIKEFCDENKIFIAGSTWLQDEELISSLAKQYRDWKFIIAPHEVSPERIRQVENLFPDSIKYSNLDSVKINDQVLIINNIGMLSSLYQYGDITFIGGGFGAGIHNTLESAAFGLPIIFGPNYEKFQEAKDLIRAGASFTIQNQRELSERMDYLNHTETRLDCGNIAKEYVLNKAGATQRIISHLRANALPL